MNTMRLHKLKYALLLMLLPLFNLTAQKIHMKDGLVFENYDGEYGLTSNRILSFIKDSNDFLWVGTSEGLNILDGKDIKHFKGYQNKNNYFKGKTVQYIIEDSKNNVLCGTKEYGLNIYNSSLGHFININEGLLKNVKSKSILSIVELNESKYVVLTKEEIIYFSLNNKSELLETSIQQISLKNQEYLRKLLIFNNKLIVSTNNRLIQYDEGKQNTIFSHKWLKSCKVKNKKLWVLTDEKIGFYTKDLNEIKWIDYGLTKGSIINNNYQSFDVSSKNEIWIGAKHQLIQLKLLNNDSVKSSKEIELDVTFRDICIDKLDNIFLLPNRNFGFIKIDGRQHQYNYIKLPKGYENSYRNKFTEDEKGYYWVGGTTGVFAYNTKTQTYHTFSNGSFKGLADRKITDQIKDSEGVVWFGTSNGVATYNSKKNNFNFYGHNAENLWNSFTHHLQSDENNNLWYVSKNRLNKINHLDRTHDFFELKGIEAIFIDVDNILWVTVRGIGLFKYNIASGKPLKIKKYFISDEILNYSTHQIINDKYGRLWITSFNGIYVYDPLKEKVVFHVNRNNLLIKEKLYGITPDNRGNFWVSQLLNPSLCISSETFKVIESSPVWMRQEGQTKVYAGPRSIDKNGKIFTEGTGGFFVYHPDSLIINKQPQKIVLQEINLNGTAIFRNFMGATSLNFNDLNHYENNLELSLKAVNPENSYFTNYAYRLLGNSNEWQYTKKLQTLKYSGLSPNNYQLEVKATNNGEIWSSPQILASFSIMPPWWKSWYAYTAYIFLILVIIYSLYKSQIKKQLAEAETLKLKEVDEFKSKFYQNITHEFRTPLTVIIGLTEQIKHKKSSIIKRNADQLLRLVNELLEVGRMESSLTKLNIKRQDIVSYSKYCLESFQSIAQQKDIYFYFEANHEEILVAYDEEKYQIILNNLLSNALKFTPNDGNIELRITATNNQVVINVKDSGAGIPLEHLKTVFDRYKTVNSQLNNNGVGIGLALAKELTQLMNGTIKVENNKDQGANFILNFPIDFTDNDEAVPVNSETYPNKSEATTEKNVILVIEDNEDVRNYIESVLNEEYKIIIAKDGKQGVDIALEIIPDIIISDVMMPEMDGYTACALIKSDFKTNHIPVILLTAKADIDSKISGLQKGADVYLAKPFNKKELLTHIENLIVNRENLKQKYSQSFNTLEISKEKTSNPFIEKLTQLILKNLSDSSFGIENVCKEMGVSRTQLHRKLKALTGLSTSIFIREIRLIEGYKMLKITDNDVSQIAYSVGFNDPFYFSKLFTEKFQVPPSKVKK